MAATRRISRLLVFFFLPLCGMGQELASLPPSQNVTPAIVTADSGIKKSGLGKNWSAWYRVGWGKAPEGFTFGKAEFWLSGERTCGLLAECRELSENDDQVLWEFRLQGNDQDGLPKVAVSEGHLRIIYRPR